MKAKNDLLWILSLVLFLLFSFSSYAQKIKVACIGNSVTYGAGIKDRIHNSYPAQLQKILGDSYEVANFGYNGATLLKNGHKPYWNNEVFQKSKNFAPQIVIVHLGLNDQGNNNWPLHKDEFIDDYLEMLGIYKNLPSKPRILICKMSPTFSGHHWFEEGMRENFKEIQLKIETVSKKAGVELIDLHEPLYRYPELFPDQIHPTKEGAKIIASKVASHISGNFGGLQLPILYGEKMVIQRNEPIIITGLANALDELIVIFNKKIKKIIVKKNGNWSAIFDSMKAGGPYTLTIKSKHSGNIKIKEVFVGEVWLASGQSNMAMDTKDIKYAESILKDSVNPNIHLFSLNGKAWPVGGTFDKVKLEICNSGSYFSASGWEKATSNTVASFSAIAYAFAFNLQKTLNIPIGIIDNSVGGSTTQSWISRESMELNHQTINLLNDTHFNPMVQPWVSKRKADNFKNRDSFGIKARHPFDPTMLYDAGINPIKNYNIKGVIWYQGESNAERINLHEMLFKTLVKDWRMHWKNPIMPFYYVQLSSINRPTWGRFRDSQRRLLTQIPYLGMAISSDVGNLNDVHPKRKWIVGNRLSKLALANDYKKNVYKTGPLFEYLNILDNKLEIHFKFAQGLRTIDNEKVKDILIAGEDKNFVAAEAEIKNNILIVWSNKIDHPRFVKYGYTPFTDGNLINKHLLPASTFSNLNPNH